MFEKKCRPNKQNERYWAPEDPEVTDEVKVVGGNKVMCFGMIVDGKVFIHWFEKGVRENQYVYLEVLQNFVWPKIRYPAGRKQLWYQQDGARCHTTEMIRNWLAGKFGARVISGKTDRPWSAKKVQIYLPATIGFGQYASKKAEKLSLDN